MSKSLSILEGCLSGGIFFFFCTMWILALNLGSNLYPLLWKSLNHWTHQGSPRVEELILGIVTIYL